MSGGAKKVIILGIDSLDSVLLSRFLTDLPNFSKLVASSPAITSISTYPPDSHTAWASIYTSWNPARHGILHFADPLDKVGETMNRDIDNTVLRGNCFWDHAGAEGKKVCILLPHLGYPVWPVNGVMVGRTSRRDIKSNPVQSSPDVSPRRRLDGLDNPRGIPSRGAYNRYLEDWKRLVRRETELGLEMLGSEDCDLFFLYSAAADWVEHTLWSFFDEGDPSYPGDNPHKDDIKQMYVAFDEMLGRFMERLDDNTVLMVLSDHGHGRRPTRLVNINEVLRRGGFLVPRARKRGGLDKGGLLDFARKKGISFVNRFARYGAGNLAARLLGIFPGARKLFTSPSSIDWEKTMAYVSDLSGIKAYEYGGVVIELKNLGKRDYEESRSTIINLLQEMKKPENGEPLFRWVRRREDLYRGDYLAKFPDIVFLFKQDYGAGWGLGGSLFSPCQTHNIVPGTHRLDTPVFFVCNANGRAAAREHITLMDVAPTILDLLGVRPPPGLDGTSLFA